ncbi:MAG: hypothetical protein HDS45_04045 [Bacteroides sp.]|nr:hypothetical protein [Bacteroides sp.]
MKNLISAVIFTLVALIMPISAAAAITGEWRSHPSFDNYVQNVIDTPERTYFMGYNQKIIADVPEFASPDCSLFYLDKESNEIVAAAVRHDLVSTSVRSIDYNPYRNYLLIIYDNNDMDLLFDSGEVYNIAALKNATIPGSKGVRSVSFDMFEPIAWIATDFGYLAIDDKKMEVKESRNYATGLDGIASVNDRLYIIRNGELYSAPKADTRSSLSDYTLLETDPGVKKIFPLSERTFLLITSVKSGEFPSKVYQTAPNSKNLTVLNDRMEYWIYDYQPAKEGVNLLQRTTIVNYAMGDNGKLNRVYKNRPADDTSVRTSSSWNLKEYYTVKPRQGIRAMRINDDKDNPHTLLSDYSMPNAPSLYYSRGMAVHPRYGLLVGNYGMDCNFRDTRCDEPILLSALKDGEWTRFGLPYTNPDQTNTGFTPKGVLVDSTDDKYVWMGSTFSGMTRLNLEDPNDIIHYSFPGDASKDLPGYVETHGIQPAWQRICPFSEPKLDRDGNLWSFFYNSDDEANIEFRYLTPTDRKATTNAANARPFRKLKSPRKTLTIGNLAQMLPLRSSVNRTILMYLDDEDLYLVNHQGTLDNTSDDDVINYRSVTDQDGGKVSLYGPACVYEDEESGTVWIGNSTGIYYCQPRNLLQGQGVLSRVKISRNDGTSFADYLLSGVAVNSITADASSRKWFGTQGAGIVVTSADGRTVLAEFTAENSDLLSDNIYQLQYVPQTNSVVISTDKGICEFFIGGGANSRGEENQVRAYPNPVAPDYYGWVTIDGLPDNSMVKIVDASGALVKELGKAEAGSIQWDVNNLHFKRVQTGVYYVLSSPASGTGESNVAKILVMN